MGHRLRSVSRFVLLFAILPHHVSREAAAQAVRQADSSRFTQPPGEETDAARRSIDQAGTALRSGSSVTSILTDPSFLPSHEWPRFRSLIRREGRSSLVTIVTPGEPGTPLVVNGRLRVGQDRPVPQARHLCLSNECPRVVLRSGGSHLRQ